MSDNQGKNLTNQTASPLAGDDAVWQKLAASVRPLKQRKKPLAETKKPADEKPARRSRPAPRPVSGNTRPLVQPATPRPADLRLGDQAGLDSQSRRRLLRGQFDIDARLDLHGLTAASAYQRLVQFVEQAHARQLRMLLVITGKGKAGEGVLRREVPGWLKQPPLSRRVLAITEATGPDGGAGALYVRLRRQRKQADSRGS